MNNVSVANISAPIKPLETAIHLRLDILLELVAITEDADFERQRPEHVLELVFAVESVLIDLLALLHVYVAVLQRENGSGLSGLVDDSGVEGVSVLLPSSSDINGRGR